MFQYNVTNAAFGRIRVNFHAKLLYMLIYLYGDTRVLTYPYICNLTLKVPRATIVLCHMQIE